MGQHWAMVGLYDYQPVETLDPGDRQTRVARSSVRMYILLKERRERGCRRVHGGLSGSGLEVVHIPSPKFP